MVSIYPTDRAYTHIYFAQAPHASRCIRTKNHNSETPVRFEKILCENPPVALYSSLGRFFYYGMFIFLLCLKVFCASPQQNYS